MPRCEEEHCRRGCGKTKALEATGHGVFQNRDRVIRTRSRMRRGQGKGFRCYSKYYGSYLRICK